MKTSWVVGRMLNSSYSYPDAFSPETPVADGLSKKCDK